MAKLYRKTTSLKDYDNEMNDITRKWRKNIIDEHFITERIAEVMIKESRETRIKCERLNAEVRKMIEEWRELVGNFGKAMVQLCVNLGGEEGDNEEDKYVITYVPKDDDMDSTCTVSTTYDEELARQNRRRRTSPKFKF